MFLKRNLFKSLLLDEIESSIIVLNRRVGWLTDYSAEYSGTKVIDRDMEFTRKIFSVNSYIFYTIYFLCHFTYLTCSWNCSHRYK